MQSLSGWAVWKSLPNREKGKLGEQLAVDWLLTKGFQVLLRNYRVGRYEVDIVAARNNLLYVVEVKLRFSIQYGDVAAYISADKIEQMKMVCTHLLDVFPKCDVIAPVLLSVLMLKGSLAYSWVELYG